MTSSVQPQVWLTHGKPTQGVRMDDEDRNAMKLPL
jgi:hypothetical protein